MKVKCSQCNLLLNATTREDKIILKNDFVFKPLVFTFIVMKLFL